VNDIAMPIRIALVNDDEVVVRGLDAMLRSYSSLLQVCELTASNRPSEPVDVALYDTFGQPQGHTRRVNDLVRNPSVRRVVVYTWNFQPWLAQEAIDLGASGYLSKSLSARELVNALVAVHDGKQVVSPAPQTARLIGGDWPGREEGLTAREAEVLTLIAQGYSNAEIADLTCLSINSIKSYIRSCYRKIDVSSRSKAVLWGIEHGMRPDTVRLASAHA
jgi:NarL family two-component system response regulator LiaR